MFQIARWATIGKEYQVQFGETSYDSSDPVFNTTRQDVQTVIYYINSWEFTDVEKYEDWFDDQANVY